MLCSCYTMVHSIDDCCRVYLSLRCHVPMSKIRGIRAPTESKQADGRGLDNAIDHNNRRSAAAPPHDNTGNTGESLE